MALGHLRRCLSLAHALDEAGASVGFACFEDAVAHQLLDGMDFHKFWLPETVNRGGDIGATARAADKMHASVIVVDSYDVDPAYFGALRQARLKTVYFEDELNTDWQVSGIINGLIGAESLPYRAPNSMLGPDHLVLGPEYSKINDLQKDDKAQLSLMVTMGGIDHYDISSRLLRSLESFKEPLTIHIVVGQYYENLENIRRAAEQSPHSTEIHLQPDSLLEIIQSCDLAVSAGGITLYELASQGVPAVGIWLWENQRQNVERLGATGAILSLAFEENDQFDVRLGEAVTGLLINDRRRNIMAEAAVSIVDGLGARRVAERLMTMAGAG